MSLIVIRNEVVDKELNVCKVNFAVVVIINGLSVQIRRIISQIIINEQLSVRKVNFEVPVEVI